MKIFISLFTFFLVMGCDGASFDGGQLPASDDPCEGILENDKCVDPKSAGSRSTTVSFSMKTVKEIPLVKTVLIVDNSKSMGEEQALLAEGIQTFAAQLKGKNVDLYLYTTSQLSAASGKYYYNNRMQFFWNHLINSTTGSIANHDWSDATMSLMKPVSDVKIKYNFLNEANAPVELNVPGQASPDFTAAPLRDMSFEYTLRPNLLENGAPLSIRQNMTDAQIAAVITKLKDSVKSVGTTGDDDEDGLCSLVRLVHENGQHKIFAEGDSVAFVILTDEDDHSDVRSCIPGQKLTNIKLRPNGALASCSGSSCTERDIKLDLYHNYVNFKCNEPSDKVPVSTQKTGYGIWGCKETGVCQVGPLPTAPATLACNAAQIDYIKRGVSETCRNSISECIVTVPRSLHRTTRRLALNKPNNGGLKSDSELCAEAKKVVEDEEKFPDQTTKREVLASPCFQSTNYAYTRPVVDGTSTGIKHQISYFSEEQETRAKASDNKPLLDRDSLINTFINKSKALFGDSGFMVSTIIRDPAADAGQNCPIEASANSSPGAAYKTLAERLGARGTVQSICANDYGPSLKKVEDYIKLIAESTFTMELKPGQKITKITRVRAGKQFVLKIGEDVRITGAKIEFLRDYDINDKYSVQIEAID